MNQFEVVDGLLAAGRVQEAIQLLRQMLASDPGNAVALSYLADVYRFSSNFELCHEALDELGRVAPGSLIFHRTSGQQLWRMGKFSEAEVHMARWIEMDPHNAIAWAEFAVIAANRSDKQKDATVREAIRRALEIDPLDIRVLLLTGDAYIGIRDFAQAVAQFRRVLEINPESLPALRGLANAYERSGNIKEATSALTTIARLSPEDASGSVKRVQGILGKKKLVLIALALITTSVVNFITKQDDSSRNFEIPKALFSTHSYVPPYESFDQSAPETEENSTDTESQLSGSDARISEKDRTVGVKKREQNVFLFILLLGAGSLGLAVFLWLIDKRFAKRRLEKRLTPETIELLAQAKHVKDLEPKKSRMLFRRKDK